MTISLLSPLRLLAVCSALSALASAAAGGEQCYGLEPQRDLINYLGATLDYSTADRICCHNHRWAEYRGYLAAPEVDLFGRLDPNVETVFYDSVCGLPLFIAPRGRSFDEFKEESLHHGWPSFRPEEIISENVIIHDNGRMESKCLTHLGHNLPKDGIDRYCIDLVCIAGAPLSSDDERVDILMNKNVITAENTITAEELDTENYVSSAEQYSGKTSNIGRNLIITFVAIAAVILAATALYLVKRRCVKKKQEVPADNKLPVNAVTDIEATIKDEEESA